MLTEAQSSRGVERILETRQSGTEPGRKNAIGSPQRGVEGSLENKLAQRWADVSGENSACLIRAPHLRLLRF